MGELAKRIATAVVLVPLVLAAIYLDPSPWGIVALVGTVAVLAQDEYLRMALPVSADDRAAMPRVLMAIVAVGCVVASWQLGLERGLTTVLLLAAPLVGLAVLLRRRHLERGGQQLAVLWSALLYVPVLLCPLAMMKLEGRPDALVVTACAAFFSDTVAYFFGRTFGRHRLYPEVSPKKTWEGSVGGLLGGMLATAGVGSLWLMPALPLGPALAIGLVASAAGQVGDLAESLLKRSFGVKDSGAILPGHGGMLDRIDALLFIGPWMYFLLPR